MTTAGKEKPDESPNGSTFASPTSKSFRIIKEIKPSNHSTIKPPNHEPSTPDNRPLNKQSADLVLSLFLFVLFIHLCCLNPRFSFLLQWPCRTSQPSWQWRFMRSSRQFDNHPSSIACRDLRSLLKTISFCVRGLSIIHVDRPAFRFSLTRRPLRGV